jgi:hypothetical protein
MTHLAWNRTHGEVDTFVIERSADPPAPGGVGINSAGATAVSVGGDVGSFSTPSLWAVLTDNTELFADGQLVQFAARLEQSPAFRRGQIAALLGNLQEQLEGMADETPGNTAVSMAAGDLVLIAHLLLRHQA